MNHEWMRSLLPHIVGWIGTIIVIAWFGSARLQHLESQQQVMQRTINRIELAVERGFANAGSQRDNLSTRLAAAETRIAVLETRCNEHLRIEHAKEKKDQ